MVVVDNEMPGDGFSHQPELNALKYGAGVVIVQTTWVSCIAMHTFVVKSGAAHHTIYGWVSYTALHTILGT